MKKKLSLILGSVVILIAFALNLSHSLNDYGYLNISLFKEILAQTTSGGTSTGGGDGCTTIIPHRDCQSITIASDSGDGICYFGFERRVRLWTSSTTKCEMPDNPITSQCTDGTVTQNYIYNGVCTVERIDTNYGTSRMTFCGK